MVSSAIICKKGSQLLDFKLSLIPSKSSSKYEMALPASPASTVEDRSLDDELTFYSESVFSKDSSDPEEPLEEAEEEEELPDELVLLEPSEELFDGGSEDSLLRADIGTTASCL